MVEIKKPIKIGLDLEGADTPPEVLFEAAQSADQGAEVSFRLYAARPFPSKPSLEVVLCPEVIHMDEDPLKAVREKKKSTLIQGIMDLKQGLIDAFITCAHTGALTSASVLFLKCFPKVKHPALLALIPTKTHPVVVLDVGAFPKALVKDYLTFAELGASYYSLQFQKEKPCVGLLNIGKEHGKGTEDVKEASKLLELSSTFSFLGNIEPKDVFLGKTDVLVTNGFSGNIFLKTVEGMAELIKREMPSYISSHHNGAALMIGVKKPLFKCHGSSSLEKIVFAIQQAKKIVEERLIERLEKAFS
jgi:phosphate acyltransferase